MSRSDPAPLNAELLQRLRPYFSPQARAGKNRLSCQMFTYCAQEREDFREIIFEAPKLGILLRGYKEIWRGDHCERILPGTVFTFPSHVPLNLVHVPDDASGLYEALILSIDHLPAGIAPLAQMRCLPPASVPLSRDLLEAVCHAAAAFTQTEHSAAICEARMSELLLLLSDSPAGRVLRGASLSERAGWHLASAPDADWHVERLASLLGTSGPTLRRQLAKAGTSFRVLLRDARLEAARRLLLRGASVNEAIAASGYASRSHFTRAYQGKFGRTPGASLSPE